MLGIKRKRFCLRQNNERKARDQRVNAMSKAYARNEKATGGPWSFSETGIDYFGALWINEGSEQKKRRISYGMHQI